MTDRRSAEKIMCNDVIINDRVKFVLRLFKTSHNMANK